MLNIPILLLAAGTSSRMGSPKALLDWKGSPLIVSRIKTLNKTNQAVIVVLGAYADQIIAHIKTLNCSYVINENWNDGMGSSIAFGVDYLKRYFNSIDGIIITTIDQPLVDENHLSKLINRFKKSQKQLLVSKSNQNWKGIPALFDAYYIEELCKLQGDSGAKIIIQNNMRNVLSVDGGDQLIDIDTPEDYKALIKSTTNCDH